METKVHFKQHKVKKQWVTIAVSSLALGAALLLGGQVGAQEVATDNLAETTVSSISELEPADNQASSSRQEQAHESSLARGAETVTATETSDQNQDHDQPSEQNQADPRSPNPEEDQMNTSLETTATHTPQVVTGGNFVSDSQGNWYYKKDGQNLTGPQVVDNFALYFHEDGKQAKDQIVTVDGENYYFDKDNGRKVTNMGVTQDGKTYLADQEGRLSLKTDNPKPVITGGHFQSNNNNSWSYITAEGEKLTGFQNVDGQILYFDAKGQQIKGEDLTINDKVYRFTKDSGALLRNQWYRWSEFNGYRVNPVTSPYSRYFGPDGAALTGWQIIDGQLYYFKEKGLLAANEVVTIKDKKYLFDKTGQLVRGKQGIVERPGYHFAITVTYQTDQDGVVLTGDQIINGQDYHFSPDGQIYSGELTRNGKKYLYIDSQLMKNFLGSLTEASYIGGLRILGRYGTDENGVILDGFARAYDGQLYYFQPNLKVPGILSVTEPSWKEIDGKLYHFEESRHNILNAFPGRVTTSTTLVKDGVPYALDEEGLASPVTVRKQFVSDDKGNWYYFDHDGKFLTGFQMVDGVQLYFDQEGKQAKGSIVAIDGNSYYFDKDSGALWTNRELVFNGLTYNIDQKGHVTSKERN